MRIQGLVPTPSDIECIKSLATAALPSGSSGNEQIWLDAVHRAQPSVDWSKHPSVIEAYKSWLNQTWLSFTTQTITNNLQQGAFLLKHFSALPLARYSRSVYYPRFLQPTPQNQQTLKQMNNPAIFSDPKWCLRGMGFTSDGRAYLVFRGTINPTNWRLNFKISAHPTGVHKGFCLAWQRLEPQVLEWLKGLPSKPPLLSITGHSLGGAIAMIAAHSLHEAYPVAEVVTFGSPRLAKPEFLRSYTNKGLAICTRRYIHETDIVPRIVPASMYAHLGEEFFITEKGAIASCAPQPTFVRFLGDFQQSAFFKKALLAIHELKFWLHALFADPTSLQGPPNSRQTAAQLLSRAKDIAPAYFGYILAILATAVAILATAYGLIRATIRVQSWRRDGNEHAMDGYEDAFSRFSASRVARLQPIFGSPILPSFPSLTNLPVKLE